MVDTCPHVNVHTCVRGGALASLTSLGEQGTRSHCGAHSRLHGCIYVCVRGGAPRKPRFARLARRPLPLFVEFICVLMLVFLFVSGVRRLASLASLASPGAEFHCGKKKEITALYFHYILEVSSRAGAGEVVATLDGADLVECPENA